MSWHYGWYEKWTEVRIEMIVKHFSIEFFKDKRILELGCGLSGLGVYFADHGAKVTCSDARQEYLDEIAGRHKHVSIMKIDLDKEWPVNPEDWDMILSLGVMYHLADPVDHIKKICQVKHIVLETECLDSFQAETKQRKEQGIDQAFNGTGSFASPLLIENTMKECGMGFTLYTGTECNEGARNYTWVGRNTKEYGHGYRRMWFGSRV